MTFKDIVESYHAYDLDGDHVPEIALLQPLYQRSQFFDPPTEPIHLTLRLVLVIVESRLFQDLPGSQYTVDDLLHRLLTLKQDLEIEGFQPKFLEMAPYSGPIHQDGKTLLAMREFFISIRNAFNNFEGAILVGSFPEASIVRTWPQSISEGEYRVGKTPFPLNPYEIVLADLDGNWRSLYHDSVNIEGYIFNVTPTTSVSKNGSKVTLTNPAITKVTASLQDVFWLQDANYSIKQPPGGPTTVELDLICTDPEVSPMDKGLPNHVSRPEICISRINARSIAVQPPSPRLLDANGKPQETANIPPIDMSIEAWPRDPNLERTLLIDYFDRNHAFRCGEYSDQSFGTSLIESMGLGTVAANDGLDGLNRSTEDFNANLLKFTQWLKRPTLFRAIATHGDCYSTVLCVYDPNADLTAAQVENECGGHPWYWIEEDGKYIPSFKNYCWGNLYLYRTLWENRVLSSLPPSLLLHVGCDVATMAHGDSVPYDNPLYGTFQNAASLLFYANQLAVLCRVTWWNRGPMGFGEAFGGSDLAVIGDGWRRVFEHVSQDSQLASQSTEGGQIYSTERKQSYIWNLVGDWTLRKYYPPRSGLGIDYSKMVAVDPLSMVLRPDIFIKLHLPRPPADREIQKYVRKYVNMLTPDQKQEARQRTKALSVYIKAMEKELYKKSKS
jgi:hypothetical protein